MAARSSPSDARRTRTGSLPTIRSRGDFARLGATGRTRADRLMTIRYVPNDLGHDRFGISTGRRLGGAATRNRVRRRIREVLRHTTNEDGRGWDILVVARPAAAAASYDELREALEGVLAAIRRGPVRPST